MLGSETQYTLRNSRDETYVSKQLEDIWETDQEIYANVWEEHLYFFDAAGRRVRSDNPEYPAYLDLLRRLS